MQEGRFGGREPVGPPLGAADVAALRLEKASTPFPLPQAYRCFPAVFSAQVASRRLVFDPVLIARIAAALRKRDADHGLYPRSSHELHTRCRHEFRPPHEWT